MRPPAESPPPQPSVQPSVPPPPGAHARLADLDPATRAAVRGTMRWSVAEGALAQTFLNWTSGSVLIGYMLHLGAGPAEIALVGSVPLLAQVASPVAAYFAAAWGRRKLLTICMSLGSRLTWVLAAALPGLGLPENALAPLLVLTVLFSSFFLAANATLWTAWMGDVVPERERGRYFGFRAGVVGVVGMGANLLAGAFLDRVGAPLSFQAVLLTAVLLGLIGVAIYLRQIDPPVARPPLRWGQMLTLPLSVPGFRRFLRFALYWQFSIMIAAPFVFPYFLQELRMSFTQVAWWTSIAATTALGSTILWGRVADRAGNRGVLAISTFLAGLLLPGTWILAGLTGQQAWFWLSAFFDAVVWGAIGPAIFNLALTSAPQANRVVFIAMYSLGTGLSGFLGGLLSGPLLLWLERFELRLLGADWTAYHWLFLISGLLRMMSWMWLRAVPEAHAWRTRDLLRAMRTGWKGLGFPWH